MEPKIGMVLEIPGKCSVRILQVKGNNLQCELSENGKVVSKKWKTMQDFYLTIERGKDEIVIHEPAKNITKKRKKAK